MEPLSVGTESRRCGAASRAAERRQQHDGFLGGGAGAVLQDDPSIPAAQGSRVVGQPRRAPTKYRFEDPGQKQTDTPSSQTNTGRHVGSYSSGINDGSTKASIRRWEARWAARYRQRLSDPIIAIPAGIWATSDKSAATTIKRQPYGRARDPHRRRAYQVGMALSLKQNTAWITIRSVWMSTGSVPEETRPRLGDGMAGPRGSNDPTVRNRAPEQFGEILGCC